MSGQANHNYCLIAGGVISALISILHMILALKPALTGIFARVKSLH